MILFTKRSFKLSHTAVEYKESSHKGGPRDPKGHLREGSSVPRTQHHGHQGSVRRNQNLPTSRSIWSCPLRWSSKSLKQSLILQQTPVPFPPGHSASPFFLIPSPLWSHGQRGLSYAWCSILFPLLWVEWRRDEAFMEDRVSKSKKDPGSLSHTLNSWISDKFVLG
jgi:hypothetical protein